ncbi:MAG: DinB family protein [Pyrinomonadaceae bacterium]
MYNSVADIFAANAEVRRKLVERVESLGEGRCGERASADGWSVADIVEHLSLTERRVSRALDGMLPHVDGDGAGAATGDAGQSFVPFSLEAFIEQSRDQKFEAPEFIRPRGAMLSESLAHLRASRAALEAMRPRFEVADYSAQFPHPAFGMLNVGQWLAFIGIHEARHLRQIERQSEMMK